MKNPYLAFFYSMLIPGLGQLYLGERAKGWTLLCMAAGVGVGLVISPTVVSWFLMGGVYLAVMIPAAFDAFHAASGHPRVFTGDSIFYVIIMLFMIGPFAIPLLWQSPKFSKGAKVFWTIAVISIVFLSIMVLTFAASFFDQIIKQNSAF